MYVIHVPPLMILFLLHTVTVTNNVKENTHALTHEPRAGLNL